MEPNKSQKSHLSQDVVYKFKPRRTYRMTLYKKRNIVVPIFEDCPDDSTYDTNGNSSDSMSYSRDDFSESKLIA